MLAPARLLVVGRCEKSFEVSVSCGRRSGSRDRTFIASSWPGRATGRSTAPANFKVGANLAVSDSIPDDAKRRSISDCFASRADGL